MLVIERNALINFLKTQKGVELSSYGMPRDAFELPVDIPFWMSGKDTAEMPHYNVPAGTMVAVAKIEKLNDLYFDELKEALAKIDIYPLGGSGDFSSRDGRSAAEDIAERKQWFYERNKIDNRLNPQAGIMDAKNTLNRLHGKQLEELVDYLADNMQLFRDRDGKVAPADVEQRRTIAAGIVSGLKGATRYTRMERDRVMAYQFADELLVTEDKRTNDYALERGEIKYHISGPKLVILRTDPDTGKTLLSPLDIDMIDKTYVTLDRKPLGQRATVHMSSVPVLGRAGGTPDVQQVWNLLESAYPHVPEAKLRNLAAEVSKNSPAKQQGPWTERAQGEDKVNQTFR